MSPHLWEVQHPGTTSEGNYTLVPNANLHVQHESFRKFLSYADHGPALVLYRWDWIKETAEFPAPGYFTHGPSKGKDRLMLFFVKPALAYCLSIAVAVTDNDESLVLAYLQERSDRLREMWEPVLDLTVDEAMDQLI